MRAYAIHGVLILVNALLLMTMGSRGALATHPGCTNCISAGDIARGAVRASELSNDLDNSITKNDIGRGAVGPSEIATDAVSSDEVADGSLRERDLAFDPVTDRELDARLAGWMHPIAWGFVEEDGRVGSASSGVSSRYDATGRRYEVSFDFVYTVNGHATILTPVCHWAQRMRYDGLGGDLTVYLEDGNGTDVRCGFSFVVY